MIFGGARRVPVPVPVPEPEPTPPCKCCKCYAAVCIGKPCACTKVIIDVRSPLRFPLMFTHADAFDSRATLATANSDTADTHPGDGTAVRRGDGMGTHPGVGAAAHPTAGMAVLPGDGGAITGAFRGDGSVWCRFRSPAALVLRVAGLRAGGRANLKPSSWSVAYRSRSRLNRGRAACLARRAQKSVGSACIVSAGHRRIVQLARVPSALLAVSCESKLAAIISFLLS